MNESKKISASAKGYCKKCNIEHELGEGKARVYAEKLMGDLEDKKRVDFDTPDDLADARLSIDYVFGNARGQMFGVLESISEKGEIVILKAFSGQYNGIWQIDGWVPPLLNPIEFDELIVDEDKKIKEIGRVIEQLSCTSDKRAELVNERRQRSQKLQQEIFGLYKVHNFSGDIAGLFEVYSGSNGIPTGTGDCCAPKLLNYAAKNNLKPLGIAEFYWGRENLSGTRKHGRFYSSCQDKCHPILGYMLCGFDG